jgi:hypothetical protein
MMKSYWTRFYWTRFVPAVITIGLAALLALYGLTLALSGGEYIEIRQSYSTGECVSMIVYSTEHPNGKVYPCPDVLPERYSHIWVQ